MYNDAFHIWHDGPYGTINGFRLGRMPTQEDADESQVEWQEINAAMGYVCLLLSTLSRKIPYEFRHARINAVGSLSSITRLKSDQVYELYGTSDFQLSRIFWTRNYDAGMVLLLQCLQELEVHARTNYDSLTHRE